MQLTIARNRKAFSSIAAWKIIGEILRRPNERTTLGVDTGEILTDVYDAMAEIYEKYGFNTSRVCIFGTTEIAGLDRDCLLSRYNILMRKVVRPLGVYDENFFMPMPFPENLARECKAFEDVIAARGGIDLQVLELGQDGSIGFNAPNTSFARKAFAGRFNTALEPLEQKKTDAVHHCEASGFTLGIGNIMQSRKILLVASGRGKAEIVRKTLYAPVTEEVPASVLRLHPCSEIVLDEEAAAQL